MLRTIRASLIIALGIASSSVLAQTVGINATGAAANPAAMLDIDVSSLPANNKKGLLIPRMTEAQRIAIPAPANGLWVYQEDDAVGRHGLWYYTSSVPGWVRMADGIGWNLTGNAGTLPTTNYLGTTDATDLVFRINPFPSERMRITAAGQLGINTTTPTEAVEVNGAIRLNNALASSLTNGLGVIRYNVGTTYHQGNVTGTPAGWEQLENAERLEVNKDYIGSQNICGPGSAVIGVSNGQSTGPFDTPFPTAFRNAKIQYFYRATELTNFGLCPGNVTQIMFFVLDDDTQSPVPGASISAEVTLYGTAAANPLVAGFDLAASAAPVNGTLVNYLVGSGNLPIPLSTPFNWNGTDNIIVEVCWTKGTVAGINPRIQLTQSGLPPLTWNRFAYDGFANIGCNIDNVNPGTATRGSSNAKRAVIQFTGQALSPQPVTLTGNYINYAGGMLIGTPLWAGGAGIFQGPGVIRAENAVYDGNVQLSDHVFDRYFEGEVRPEDADAAMALNHVELDQLQGYLAENRHLPNMPSREDWAAAGVLSLGDLSTRLWVSVEQQALYIAELENQLKVLERMTYGKGLTDAEVHDLIQKVENNKGMTAVQKAAMIEELRGTVSPASTRSH